MTDSTPSTASLSVGRVSMRLGNSMAPRADRVRTFTAVVLVCLGMLLGASRASADLPGKLRDVGIDQHLNAQVPADIVFKDETGTDVHLGQYFNGKKPVVLALVYFKCPMLCTMVLNELTRTLNGMPLNVGTDFDVLTVSFDPHETPELARDKKKQYLRAYGRPHADEGWHFLTGSEDSIKKLTNAVGFRYAWDPENQQFIHASGIMVLTPEGRISKYFYGIEYSDKDLRFALLEAARNQIGTLADVLLLFCFHYDATIGRYSLAIVNILKVAAGLTILVVGAVIALMLMREHRNRRAAAAKAGATDQDESMTDSMSSSRVAPKPQTKPEWN